MTIDPQNCMTMTEVRTGVDAVDAEIAALLGRRFGYMAAAARIKQNRDMVRDETRKAAVIRNARANARANGVPEGFAAALWDTLVEASIAYEMELFDAKNTA